MFITPKALKGKQEAYVELSEDVVSEKMLYYIQQGRTESIFALLMSVENGSSHTINGIYEAIVKLKKNRTSTPPISTACTNRYTMSFVLHLLYTFTMSLDIFTPSGS